MVNWDSVRDDFPILSERRNGKPIVYFDNACLSLKPKLVIDAMNDYYLKYTACHGRSIHKFATETTEAYEKARQSIARLLNARANEIIYMRNTTEGINLVAQGLDWKAGDEVLTLDIEHNSNLLPWQRLARERGVVHKIVKTNSDGSFNMENFSDALSERTKLVSFVHTSNVFATTIPAADIAKKAHKAGALFMLDAAQSAPHFAIDVKNLDCDFLAFSGHKLYGPTGTGVLYGKADLLNNLNRLIVGGETVENSTYTTEEVAKPPAKFEAGLQNYAGAIGLGAAASYLMKLGMKNIEARDQQLIKRLMEAVKLDKLKVMSSLTPSDPVVSFNIEGMPAHEVAIMLDEVANIFVRSGRHCVHSWFNANGMHSSVRASLAFYNSESEIELFSETLKKIIELA